MDRQLVAVVAAVILTTAAVVAASQADVSSPLDREGTAAVVQLSGPISSTASSGLGSVQGITPDRVRRLNEKAASGNPDAIIYEINSGGGAVVASKDVRRAIDDVETTTVCRFQDVSASGGYLAALGCDRIVADSASLTGSIGVKSSYFQVSGLLDRLGVKYVNVSSGEYKELGSPYSNLSEEERRILQSKAERIHQEFVDDVVEERNLTDSQVETVRTGEPFLGERARELGLVDRLGGREAAVRAAESATGKNLTVREVETSPQFNILSLLTAELGVQHLLGTQVPLKAEI